MLGFTEGLRYPFRGLGFLRAHRELWKYAAGAFALNFLFFTAGIIVAFLFLPDFIHGLVPEKTPAWLVPVIRFVLYAAVAVVALFLFTVVGNVVAGPFLDAMTERMLELLGESVPPWRGLGNAIGRAVGNQTWKLLIFGVIQLSVLILWITPLAFLHGPVACVVTVYFLALEYIDYPLDVRRVSVPSRFAYVWRHRRPAFGFGTACFALALVPFLLYFLLPSAVAGAVLLVRDMDGLGSKASGIDAAG